MSEILKAISDGMDELEINYEFLEWTSEPAYPYFVGEYQEVPSLDEDGEQETTIILTGFARGNEASLALEEAKQKIKAYFPKVGGKLVSGEESTLAIFYSDALIIPTGEAELKKIQINLIVKEWSVN